MHKPSLDTMDARDPVRLATERAVRSIPPLWPLASSVAVNPFLGQAGDSLAAAGARLARVAGIRVTMPRSWYRERMEAGDISDADLQDALARSPAPSHLPSVAALRDAAALEPPEPVALPTVADIAARVSGTDWPGLIAERIGAWAAGYFDEGQATWPAPLERGAYAEWRAVATCDLTPEIAGLRGFTRHVAQAPADAAAAIERVAGRLGLTAEAMETYFHQMLVTTGGWAQYARYRLWLAELAGQSDPTVRDLLAIRLLWEEALYLRYQPQVDGHWADVRARHASPLEPTPDLMVDTLLQDAAECAAQRRLAATLARGARATGDERPALQAAFCIDVRSEVFRRALETVSPAVRTLGFAGFFGLPAAHRRYASDIEELRLPVLLNPALRSRAATAENPTDERSVRVAAQAHRAWERFKLAAVSCFAFVEAAGPLYVAKLLRDTLGLRTAPAPHDPPPQFDPPLQADRRADVAESVLRAMSLTTGYAPLVLLVGHGASVTNNAHASSLHCGACGGYPGDVNARLLAAILNEPVVRAALVPRGIEIPPDTLFVAALHDTTTDRVTLYDHDHPSAAHRAALAGARSWLDAAGRMARTERALRLPRADHEGTIARRSRDWSETRPEWALAGCMAFVAAPRARTAGTSLAGRAFLHDYDWTRDEQFKVLELVLTAPVVVASWISLQYYGSTVAPAIFGAGNKLLHNVTGGIGVIEGNGGLLRAGLPWQSVHDGERWMHEPLRLTVCIEAPVDAITGVLERHGAVRALFDNGWLHLRALDDAGRMAWRYAGGLQWVPTEPAEQPRGGPLADAA